MKKFVWTALSVLFALSVVTLNGQSECKVLLPGIAGSYNGECRKGLADGKGEAVGTDSYTGDFKKGLPDGEGTYKWASGAVYTGQWKKGLRDGKGSYSFIVNEKDSVQNGFWEQDVYMGAEQIIPYAITFKTGVTRASFFKQGTDDNFVSFKFARTGGGNAFNIAGLTMQGSSGSESVTTAFSGFLNTSFPFEGKVKFQAPNLLNTVINNYEMRFVINQPGDWVVTIYY